MHTAKGTFSATPTVQHGPCAHMTICQHSAHTPFNVATRARTPSQRQHRRCVAHACAGPGLAASDALTSRGGTLMMLREVTLGQAFGWLLGWMLAGGLRSNGGSLASVAPLERACTRARQHRHTHVVNRQYEGSTQGGTRSNSSCTCARVVEVRVPPTPTHAAAWRRCCKYPPHRDRTCRWGDTNSG